MDTNNMWEPYLRAALPDPTHEDRTRLEALAGAPLPDRYWEVAIAHQGEALDEDLVQDPAFMTLVLLLVSSPELLEKDEASYSIETTVSQVMHRYPSGLLPFADDTGGNLWAFDYRTNPANPSIVFIDHELEGADGVTAVAADFARLLTRIGIA